MMNERRIGLLVLLAWLGLWSMPCAANTFTVVNSGASDYVINGANDPALTLYRGRTYTFNINASGHPFWIKTAAVTGTGSAYNDGVTGNGTQVGTLTFAVPTNAPSALFYNCEFHAAMTGALNIEDSPQHGWWRFEDLGTNALDYSGRQLHGVITNQNAGADDGASGYSADVPGALIVAGSLTNANLRSFRFARNLRPIRITDATRFRLTNNPSRVTVEAFVKLTGSEFPMRIVDVRRTDIPEPPPPTLISPFFSSFPPVPLMAISVHSDATTNYVTQFASSIDPSPVALGQWHHVAIVADTNNVRFFVDYQAAGTPGFSQFTPGTFTNITSLVIGGLPQEFGNGFQGLMDEIRITADALAPTQFLRVAGGLAPGIRAIGGDPLAACLTVTTASGAVYRVQGATNLLAGPGAWADTGGTFTGRIFYTTVTNSGAPLQFYRALRDPGL